MRDFELYNDYYDAVIIFQYTMLMNNDSLGVFKEVSKLTKVGSFFKGRYGQFL